MPQIQDTPYLEQNLPMPFSLEAEQSVLGAVLVDSSCLTTVMEYIKPECFYDKRHQGIFAVMLRFFGAGQPIDFVTVLDGVISDEVFASEQDAKSVSGAFGRSGSHRFQCRGLCPHHSGKALPSQPDWGSAGDH